VPFSFSIQQPFLNLYDPRTHKEEKI